MRVIPMFARYRAWKAFNRWRRTVRDGEGGGGCAACVAKRQSACRRVYRTPRCPPPPSPPPPCPSPRSQIQKSKRQGSADSLAGQLFLLNPTLRTALRRLRHLCFEVNSWSLFAYDAARTYTLSEFVAQQNVKRIQVTTWLTEFSADVRALVRGACDEMLDSFLAANNIRADHKMTFMERSALRAECRRLTKFVRLADFVVRDTLLKLALDSASALLQYIVPPPALVPPRVIRTDLPATGVDEDGDRGGKGGGLGLSFDAIVPAQGGKSKKHVVAAPMFVVEASFDAVVSYVEQVVEDVAAAMAEGATLVTVLGPSGAAGVVESKDDDAGGAAASPSPSDVVEGEGAA
jgi:hypothetical protein